LLYQDGSKPASSSAAMEDEDEEDVGAELVSKEDIEAVAMASM
jgi:hypothetical protein